VGTRPGGRCDMSPSQIITDYRLSQKRRNIFTGEMYLTVCVEWAYDHFCLSLTQIDHFWRKYARKWFLHFCFQWPWPL